MFTMVEEAAQVVGVSSDGRLCNLAGQIYNLHEMHILINVMT